MQANRITASLYDQQKTIPYTLLPLARYFGASPQCWLKLQETYELRRSQIKAGWQIANA